MLSDIFISVIEISLSIGMAVLVLILLTPFLNRRYAAKWKYWIWLLLALRLIIPLHGMESIAGGLTRIANPTAQASGESHAGISPVGIASQVGIVPAQGVVIKIPAQMTAPIVVLAGDKYALHITMLEIITAIWLAGALSIILLHIFSYQQYMRQLRKRGILVNDNDILCKLQDLKEELRIRRGLSVIRYAGAASPMIIGFIHPVLVLPQEAYCPEELEFILKHELIHLKRGDVYVKLLLMAANAVHWFNPAIWIMQREAVVDMELSCDERVVQGTNYSVRKAYTETLLSTLYRACPQNMYFSTQFYGGKQIMKKRFLNILTKPKKRNGVVLLAGAIILAVCLEIVFGGSVVNGASGHEVVLSYIKGFDGEVISFDAVEWVEVPSERAAELGLSESEWEDAGFCVYNEDTTLRELPLAKDCICEIYDWTVWEGYVTVSAEELLTILEERIEMYSDITPYELTIQDGKIIRISEHYVP